jgi:anti-sigma B factor antagonist
MEAAMRIRMYDETALLAPSGWIMGGDETDALNAAIERLLDSGNRRLVLDLRDVSMMNSTALGVLTAARAAYQARGGQIVLCNVDARINHILLITKLALLFDAYPDVRTARQAVATPQIA